MVSSLGETEGIPDSEPVSHRLGIFGIALPLSLGILENRLDPMSLLKESHHGRTQ